MASALIKTKHILNKTSDFATYVKVIIFGLLNFYNFLTRFYNLVVRFKKTTIFTIQLIKLNAY